ncbi:MAG: OST-HTH/LOTUS domain-containing protein, partial [Actinomycetota bacterium]
LKLRELNRRVIGVGVEGSTSELLPGACDEFLFYERLLGPSSAKSAPKRRRRKVAATNGDSDESTSDLSELARLTTKTLTGLQRSSDGSVLSSMVKRAILRKDPTFSESDYGFRTWSELMRYLETSGIVELKPGTAEGDPLVDFPSDGGGEGQAFELLKDVVAELEKKGSAPPLSGLKDLLRKRKPGFSEKDYGYGGFLQFVKAASAKGLVDLQWNDEAEDYYLSTN